MPEALEESSTVAEEVKQSKILKFFGTAVKETKKEKVKPLSKIIIRRLPPKLSKEAFLEEFELPPHDYFNFVRGDLSLGNQAFARAYVNFTKSDDIYAFKEKYDDYPMQDEHGREYHVVVEWAPVQRVPKKSSQKKPVKTASVETDPKYVAFLEALEKEKSAAGNTAEYFMETDSFAGKKAEVTTTPLLEYIKLKRQQKIDIRAENRLRKREAEKERRRKEDELRKVEKQKKVKEREKRKSDDTPEPESKTRSTSKVEVTKEDVKSTERKHTETIKGFKNDRPVKETFERKEKSFKKVETQEGNDGAIPKSKREVVEDKKTNKPPGIRKERPTKTATFKPSEKIESRVKNVEEEPKEKRREPEEKKREPEQKRREPEEKKREPEEKRQEPAKGETKSRYRYSEQRKDREMRNQKSTESKDVTKSVEKEKEKKPEEVRSKAPEPRIRRQSTQETSDASGEGEDDKSSGSKSSRRDPRTERRIRNKDRPSIEIYRPGMGKFSKQRMEKKKDDNGDSDDRQSNSGRERSREDKKLKNKEEESSVEGKEKKEEKTEEIPEAHKQVSSDSAGVEEKKAEVKETLNEEIVEASRKQEGKPMEVDKRPEIIITDESKADENKT